MTLVPNFHAFRIEFGGRAKEIVTDAGIYRPFNPKDGHQFPHDDPRIFKTKALWDTGATNCAITEKVAKSLGIMPISSTKVSYGDGLNDANVYLISVFLPNGLIIPAVKATECKNVNETWDLIIGMDIIGHSDFAITNVNNKTQMTFRLPSVRTIDFVKEAQEITAARYKDVGRNHPCPCGSGKKYKACHGMPGAKP